MIARYGPTELHTRLTEGGIADGSRELPVLSGDIADGCEELLLVLRLGGNRMTGFNTDC